jgi:hypothetical protein
VRGGPAAFTATEDQQPPPERTLAYTNWMLLRGAPAFTKVERVTVTSAPSLYAQMWAMPPVLGTPAYSGSSCAESNRQRSNVAVNAGRDSSVRSSAIVQ